ncbi:MAG: carboxypeptidase-like regulatory domain-containing protein, partial [Planctomycetota bacterium]
MRTVSIAICLKLLCVLNAPGQGAAQVSGLVRGPEGKALAQAKVAFYPEQASDLPWLSALLPPPPARTSASEASGRFRIDDPAGRGTIWIEHENGLGGLIHNIDAGVPRLLKTAPMAEISLASGGAFMVEIRGIKPDGSSVYLGQREGRAIRIPAGEFILLVHLQGRLHEVPLTLRSGERRQLTLPDLPSGNLLNWDPAKSELFLIGWPHAIRHEADGATLPAAWGLGRLRRSIIFDAAQPKNRLFSEHWFEPKATLRLTLPWTRPLEVRTVDREGAELGRVMICSIGYSNSEVSVHALGYTDPNGQLQTVHRLSPQTTHLVGMSKGYAAMVQPIVQGVTEYQLRLTKPYEIRLRVLDPQGKALAGARVMHENEQTGILDRSAYSNGRGEVTFTNLAE